MTHTHQKVDLLPKMHMQNGSTVIEFHPTSTKADGEHTAGIVLAVYRDEYVTWRVSRDTQGEVQYGTDAVWWAEIGNYFHDIAKAGEDFNRRCERSY